MSTATRWTAGAAQTAQTVDAGSGARPWMDSYGAGIGIGLALLGAYLLAGRGLGASGGFAAVVAAATTAVDAVAASTEPIAPYVATPLWQDWIVLELVGVAAGAWLSARLAGRSVATVERGAAVRVDTRLVTALCGGFLMAFGAKLAHGCTSGQALSGGALLSAGSWLFIATTFASGYLLFPFARRLWR